MDPLNESTASVQITRLHYEAMMQHVAGLTPEEACGLVAGSQGRSTEVIPIENVLHSRVRFKMEPAAQLAAFTLFDRKGWDLLAIYHSHPDGPTHPSDTDLIEAYYPEAVYLIWFQANQRWECQAYHIADHQARLAKITVVQ